MPFTHDLQLGERVYLKANASNDKPFYIVAAKLTPSPLDDTRVAFQISQDIPFMHSWGRGTWPNELSLFPRSELYSQAEFDEYMLNLLETSANKYERTLTHMAIIELECEEEYHFETVAGGFVLRGTETLIPLGTNWSDWIGVGPIALFYDKEDGGGASELDPLNHDGLISWDGLNYDMVADPGYILITAMVFNDGETIVAASELTLNTVGKYTLSFVVIDAQGIWSYPKEVQIHIHPEVLPTNEC